jgi:P-type Ca2+ transporter type 2C
MVKENSLVRVLRACETMGNVTVICSDKTGTLTQNVMTVVAGTWGSDESFGQMLTEDDDSGPATQVSESFKRLSVTAKGLIVKSIALNTTAFEGEAQDGRRGFIGSKTEVAMLQLARDHLGMNLTEQRASSPVVQLYPFDSSRKCMGIVYREPSGDYRFLVKGASELMLNASSRLVTELSRESISTGELSEELRGAISHKIESYAQKSLRTIGIVYKDFPTWPPTLAKTPEGDSDTIKFGDVFRDMVWIGVVGIQDPMRVEVPAAIRKCFSAGVQVKMVTGFSSPRLTALLDT